MSEQLAPDHQVSMGEIGKIVVSQVIASAVGPRGHKYLEFQIAMERMQPMFFVRTRRRINDHVDQRSFAFLWEAVAAYNEAPGP